MKEGLPMDSMIQNIFMDMKSYEMIREAVSVEEIINIVGQIDLAESP